MAGLTRRTFLAGAAATAAAARRAHAAQAPPPAIAPREAWAEGLPDPGALPTEAPGDVRVLVVHHSASGNDYDAADVPGILRGFHRLHTDRGWPDVAYNVFVDRYGGLWEGRAGSLEGPVIGDATGGNQGFSQLVCLVGDFRTAAPTPEAVESLTAVLAWLAQRDGVDPLGTASFVSRGSNRWPAGETVEVPAICGHRDLSQTECPGDAAYAIVTGDLPQAVAARLAPPAPTTAATTATTTTTATTAVPPTSQVAAPARTPQSGGSLTLPAAAAAGAALLVGGLLVRRRNNAS